MSWWYTTLQTVRPFLDKNIIETIHVCKSNIEKCKSEVFALTSPPSHNMFNTDPLSFLIILFILTIISSYKYKSNILKIQSTIYEVSHVRLHVLLQNHWSQTVYCIMSSSSANGESCEQQSAHLHPLSPESCTASLTISILSCLYFAELYCYRHNSNHTWVPFLA